MNKAVVCLFLAFLTAAPITILAQEIENNQNPYSVNDPRRNFYTNLGEKQKSLLTFREAIADARKTADKAGEAVADAIAEGNRGSMIETAVEAAESQITNASVIGKASVDLANLTAAEAQELNDAKNDILGELAQKAAHYINIAELKMPALTVGSGTDGLAKIDAVLRQNGIGLDKSGFFVKYNDKGDVVEYEMPEGYLRQKGDTVIDVPFFAQAPGGGWFDTCQGAACEEATLIQAHMWIDHVDYSDKFGVYDASDMLQRYGLRQILAMCDYEYDNFPSHLYHDTSTTDTARLWQSFYGHPSKVIDDPTLSKLKRGIDAGHTYVIPINGQKILTSLPYADPAKVPAHSILLVGYNDLRGEFIVNDPGTWRGQGWRFNQNDLMAAIRDYPSGKEEAITNETKRVLQLPTR
jgi:hypothetical protein